MKLKKVIIENNMNGKYSVYSWQKTFWLNNYKYRKAGTIFYHKEYECWAFDPVWGTFGEHTLFAVAKLLKKLNKEE